MSIYGEVIFLQIGVKRYTLCSSAGTAGGGGSAGYDRELVRNHGKTMGSSYNKCK